eukprot:TRINITY_DN5194_c0_g1_i2.p1 TRINITY_DN5194_c0_g1~~TRINITY_DN5194_c0_g1_i2.p1  ORF type:complete len:653 (+),score=67.01 TRINITY_DN5194_c0_g1_i2:145-2103(+)
MFNYEFSPESTRMARSPPLSCPSIMMRTDVYRSAQTFQTNFTATKRLTDSPLTTLLRSADRSGNNGASPEKQQRIDTFANNSSLYIPQLNLQLLEKQPSGSSRHTQKGEVDQKSASYTVKGIPASLTITVPGDIFTIPEEVTLSRSSHAAGNLTASARPLDNSAVMSLVPQILSSPNHNHSSLTQRFNSYGDDKTVQHISYLEDLDEDQGQQEFSKQPIEEEKEKNLITENKSDEAIAEEEVYLPSMASYAKSVRKTSFSELVTQQSQTGFPRNTYFPVRIRQNLRSSARSSYSLPMKDITPKSQCISSTSFIGIKNEGRRGRQNVSGIEVSMSSYSLSIKRHSTNCLIQRKSSKESTKLPLLVKLERFVKEFEKVYSDLKLPAKGIKNAQQFSDLLERLHFVKKTWDPLKRKSSGQPAALDIWSILRKSSPQSLLKESVLLLFCSILCSSFPEFQKVSNLEQNEGSLNLEDFGAICKDYLNDPKFKELQPLFKSLWLTRNEWEEDIEKMKRGRGFGSHSKPRMIKTFGCTSEARLSWKPSRAYQQYNRGQLQRKDSKFEFEVINHAYALHQKRGSVKYQTLTQENLPKVNKTTKTKGVASKKCQKTVEMFNHRRNKTKSLYPERDLKDIQGFLINLSEGRQPVEQSKRFAV